MLPSRTRAITYASSNVQILFSPLITTMHEDTKTEQVSQIFFQKGVNTSNITQRLGLFSEDL